MKPIRTYEISVHGFPPGLYCARSPAKARARCYRDYSATFDCATFKDFLKISTLRTVPNPPGVGDRIMVGSLPATRIYHPCAGHYTWFMRDDSDTILCSHPADVQPMPAAA